MQRLSLWISVVAAIAAPAVFGQNLDVRTGLWETTSTTVSSGPPPIDTSKLPPEQRERIEAAMKAAMARAAQPQTSKSCVTKEKIADSFLKGAPENCKRTMVTNSRNKLEVKVSCQGTSVSDMDLLIEALSRESVKVTGHMNVSNAGRSMTMNINGSGKWIADACGDVK